VGGDPVNKTDPTGQIAETPWDVANVGMGVASLAGNVASGNVGGALVDAAGLAYDVAATVFPGLPGGAGTLIKAGRVGEALEASARAVKGAHGNKVDERPATLYAKYDKDGNFLKWGVTKHENPSKRYTRSQIDGGTVRPLERGARSEMIKKERDLVERSPGPANREPWAGRARDGAKGYKGIEDIVD